MPFRPRKRLARKSAKKPKLSKPTAKAVKAIVKSQMGKVIETKTADYHFEPLAINSLYHNSWYQMESDPFNLNQGVQDQEAVNPSNRIGDSIFAKGIKFNILFQLFSDRPNLALRILVLKVKPDTPFLTNPTNHAQAVSNIVMPVDQENSRWKQTIYDRTFVVNNNVQVAPGVTLRDGKFHWQHYVKVNKVIRYEDSNSASRNFTYQIYVCAYDTISSLTTDNIARFSYTRRTYFQDA